MIHGGMVSLSLHPRHLGSVHVHVHVDVAAHDVLEAGLMTVNGTLDAAAVAAAHVVGSVRVVEVEMDQMSSASARSCVSVLVVADAE